MKTKEEIEQLAEKEMMGMEGRFGFVAGYEKCQEDMADKKYTEDDMLKCWNTAFTDAMNIDSETYKPIFYSDFINSLNKQD
jgi:hypothetical protein